MTKSDWMHVRKGGGGGVVLGTRSKTRLPVWKDDCLCQIVVIFLRRRNGWGGCLPELSPPSRLGGVTTN